MALGQAAPNAGAIAAARGAGGKVVELLERVSTHNNEKDDVVVCCGLILLGGEFFFPVEGIFPLELSIAATRGAGGKVVELLERVSTHSNEKDDVVVCCGLIL